jgi:hypothetical protein
MMKKYITASLFILFTIVNIMAQSRIELSYVSAEMGDNMTALWTRNAGSKIRYGVGLNVHINQPLLFPGNAVFYRAGHAYSFKEHLGMVATFKYKIKPQSWIVTPYLSYLTQASFKSTRVINYSPAFEFGDTSGIIMPKGKDFYIRQEGVNWTGGSIVWENYITLSLESKITDKLNISFTAGGGATLFPELGNYLELSPYASVGLSYDLSKAKK